MTSRKYMIVNYIINGMILNYSLSRYTCQIISRMDIFEGYCHLMHKLLCNIDKIAKRNIIKFVNKINYNNKK